MLNRVGTLSHPLASCNSLTPENVTLITTTFPKAGQAFQRHTQPLKYQHTRLVMTSKIKSSMIQNAFDSASYTPKQT